MHSVTSLLHVSTPKEGQSVTAITEQVSSTPQQSTVDEVLTHTGTVAAEWCPALSTEDYNFCTAHSWDREQTLPVATLHWELVLHLKPLCQACLCMEMSVV